MRLRDPKVGTVVRCEGDLAAYFQARGWVDAETPVETPDDPAPKRRGRPPKNS